MLSVFWPIEYFPTIILCTPSIKKFSWHLSCIAPGPVWIADVTFDHNVTQPTCRNAFIIGQPDAWGTWEAAAAEIDLARIHYGSTICHCSISRSILYIHRYLPISTFHQKQSSWYLKNSHLDTYSRYDLKKKKCNYIQLS